METLKYRTEIDGKSLPIPKHILDQVDRWTEIEVVFRPIRRNSSTATKREDVIRKIEKQMNEEFPNLKGSIGKELAGMAVTLSDIPKDMDRYTDRERIGMARIEKYLEKGEIIENLF